MACLFFRYRVLKVYANTVPVSASMTFTALKYKAISCPEDGFDPRRYPT